MHLLPAPNTSIALLSASFLGAVQRISMAFFLGSATFVISGAPVLALPSDSSQAITLEADRATYNEKSGITTYTGNVIIQQGTIKIQADSLVANLNKNRQIQQITAKGRPAKFQQQISADKGIARGEGQSIVYNSENGVITMTGNAYLTQDGASFRGNTLRYSISAGDVEATGNSSRRVQLIIPPSATQNQSKARSN
jgi:lipopolysaccharide export system protein LptA